MNIYDVALRHLSSRSRTVAETESYLLKKGFSEEETKVLIEDYEPEDSETERARRETERVLRLAGIDGGDPVPEKVRGRVARRLQAKGYSSDIIYSIIGELKR